MSLSAEQIEKNWNEYRKRVNELFPERANALNKMYDYFEERMALMPASSTDHFHNAFEGGYVDHVLRVMDCAESLYNTWEASGASVDGFSKEELLFAAMHHDLGKAGFPQENGEVYIPNDSEWHRKNQGKMYKHNPNIPFTMVPDLSLWTLQHFAINVSWNEYQAIRIHDGLYDDANKPYYISRSPEAKLRNNMALILHHADHMAARIEYEMWRDKKPTVTATPVTKTVTKKTTSTELNAQDLFKDLFGDN
jgi:hypothetical protein